MLLHRLILGLALVAGFIAAAGYDRLCAADDKTDAKPDKAKAESADAPKEEPKPAEVDPFQVPEGGVKELLAFIKQTMAFRPKTQAEMAQYRLKGIAALKAAAQKALEIAKPEDRELEGFNDVEGVLLLLRASELKPPSALERIRGDLKSSSTDERQQLVSDLKTYFANNQIPSKYALSAAMQAASGLEYGGNPEQAAEIYRDLGATIARSKDPETAKAGAKLEGAARRLTLLGNTMEVGGTEMDGTAFDWAKLRGKVVLVDFWATWCGPCRAELPNVKKNYELYHEKGFEVVGISLDNDRSALEAFLEKEQNPWITLYDGGWNDNAVAMHYGVMGIPTVILVDQEGRVVSTRARGPELGKQLAKLLGPAEPKEPAENDKPAEKDEPAEKEKPADAAK